MAIYFLDSSAVVKYYVNESGSAFVRRIVRDEQSFCFVANITLAEVAAAFAQLQREGPFGNAFVRRTYSLFSAALQNGQFVTHTVDAETIALAAELVIRHPLKGYDAVQIASAQFIQRRLASSLTLIAGDKQMLRAAQAEGLTTADPEAHINEDVKISTDNR